jgi:LysM repeat protein
MAGPIRRKIRNFRDFGFAGPSEPLHRGSGHSFSLYPMKHLFWLPLFSLAALLFSSCASTNTSAGYAADTGPFDEYGNYRDDWADDPTKWRRPGGNKPATQLAKIDQPPANAVPITRSSTPPARPAPPTTPRVQTAPKPKPKPTVAAKPKPKPKPTATRYTVKKGDSLYAIALRNRTSVAAIQKANNISGSLIRPGQSLIIPKR